jgi:hypothetical protein
MATQHRSTYRSISPTGVQTLAQDRVIHWERGERFYRKKVELEIKREGIAKVGNKMTTL